MLIFTARPSGLQGLAGATDKWNPDVMKGFPADNTYDHKVFLVSQAQSICFSFPRRSFLELTREARPTGLEGPIGPIGPTGVPGLPGATVSLLASIILLQS